MPRPVPWTDDQLREAVASCTTLFAVCRELGLSPGGGSYDSIRRHVKRIGIDGSHITGLVLKGNRLRRSWTDDDLRRSVARCASISAVIRELGFKASGGMHRFISGHIRRLGLDTSHFTGQSWMKDRRRPAEHVLHSLESILVAGSHYRNTGKLRERLIRAGLKQRLCEQCGRDEWLGRPITLELDHINGDTCDNRIENLRILCPNCHSQTDTWCRRKAVPAVGLEPTLSRF